MAALQRIMRAGISVRGQIVLLKGINDDAGHAWRIAQSLRMLSVVPYYLFHCMDVLGSYHFRTSVQKGIDILAALAVRSGSCPTYVYVTPVGKHRIAPGSALDYRMIDGKRYWCGLAISRGRFPRILGSRLLAAIAHARSRRHIVSHYLDGNDEAVA